MAGELARLQGDAVEVAQHTRLFELGELVPPVGVPGWLRTATLDDLDLAKEWVDRFMHDADVQAGRDPVGQTPTDARRSTRRTCAARSSRASTGSGSTRRGSGCT